jgi:hypothetical protein
VWRAKSVLVRNRLLKNTEMQNPVLVGRDVFVQEVVCLIKI